MNITINDIHALQEFSGMKIIAGKAGLNNVVTKCGILDYEYDKAVKEKYSQTNFCEGQLVLSSFLYAKDNEFLLLEAIKNLINRGCSGLIIKNIFKIKLTPSLLHYADQKNFPILLITKPDYFFEDIIVRVSELIKEHTSIHLIEKQIDALLHTHLDQVSLSNLARKINPSIHSDSLVIFYRHTHKLEPKASLNYLEQLQHLFPLQPSDSLFYYKNGFMLIHTRELLKESSMNEIIQPFVAPPSKLTQAFSIGISNIHHNLFELKQAITESIHATILQQNDEKPYQLYQDLGVFQILLPFVGQPEFIHFSQKYIKTLQEYDDENQTKLLDTAIQFILSDGDISKTAQKLNQHQNTIRYRLEKISTLNNENILNKEHYEKISIALKIYLCTKHIQNFKETAS